MADVKPTRMELLRLRKKLKTSQRGHKLLKKKRDGLMQKFMEIIRDARKKREEMEKELSGAGKEFALSCSNYSEKEIEQFFAWPNSQIKVSAEKDNIMGVEVPEFKSEVQGDFRTYSYSSFPLGGEKSLQEFWGVLDTMLELASLEHTARLLSYEIESTRRRVNSLEYVVIPKIKRQINYISGKLEERERTEKIISMKVKEMINK